MLFNIIIISVSLSIDALGIGVSYKLKGVKISTEAKFIIGIISSLMMWGAVNLGKSMSGLFSDNMCKIIGISILVLMGASIIRNSIYSKDEATYDMDKSSDIKGIEAVLLGIALSIDSVSAGIAIAAIGFGNILIPVIVGFMQMFFLYLGDFLISRFHKLQNLNSKVCGFFSGLLLILIALIRLFNS